MKKLMMLLLVQILVGFSKVNATIVLSCNDEEICESSVPVFKLEEENQTHFDKHGKVKWILIGTAITKKHTSFVFISCLRR